MYFYVQSAPAPGHETYGFYFCVDRNIVISGIEPEVHSQRKVSYENDIK